MKLANVGAKVRLKKGQATGIWRDLKGKVAIVTGHDDSPSECVYYELDWGNDDLNEEYGEMQSDVFEEAIEKSGKIFAVTEWIDNSSTRFYFDTSKVNPSEPFEAAYFNLLQKAQKSRSKIFDATNDNSIVERFGEYQDGMRKWTRLLVKPPCQVDYEVEIVLQS